MSTIYECHMVLMTVIDATAVNTLSYVVDINNYAFQLLMS